MVKNLSAMQETWVQSLDQEDALEKGMATHFSSCLENSMDRGAWWARVRGVTKSWTQLSENFNTTSYKEKGLISIWFFQNSSCYCLGNLGGKEILS